MHAEEQRLADWLQQATPEPPREITVADVAERVGARRRQWWLPALAAAAGVVVVAALAVGLSHSPTSSTAPGTSSPTPRTSSAPSPPPTPTPSALPVHPWGATLVRDIALVADSTTVLDGRLYGEADNGQAATLYRLDPSTGRPVAQAGDVRLLARPAAAAGLVWTLRSDGRAVLGLDPVTLAVKVTVRVSATTGVATQGKATVVVGANRQVSFVRDGQVVRRLDVDGQLSGLAVSPDGTRLYVAIQEGGAPGPGRIETLDPRTGAALAAPVPTGGTPGGLQATAGGLWLTSSSGMHSGMAFLPDGANRLRPVNAGQSGGGLLTRPAFSDGAVWLGSYGTLGCADPGTGAIRARVPVGTDKRGDVIAGVSGLAALGGKVYAVYSGVNGGPESALIVMTPPAACFGN